MIFLLQHLEYKTTHSKYCCASKSAPCPFIVAHHLGMEGDMDQKIDLAAFNISSTALGQAPVHLCTHQQNACSLVMEVASLYNRCTVGRAGPGSALRHCAP